MQHLNVFFLNIFLTITDCFSGLRSGPLPTAEMAGREVEASRHHRILGPQRSQSSQGHLETGSVLPERQTCRVSICNRTQRLDTHQTGWRYSIYAQVIFDFK